MTNYGGIGGALIGGAITLAIADTILRRPRPRYYAVRRRARRRRAR